MTSHVRQHLSAAIGIIAHYNGKSPFSGFLKEHFREHKKYGSRDRKTIASLCYNFFRAAHSLTGLSQSDQFIAATLLCSDEPNDLLATLHVDWNNYTRCTPSEKFDLVRAAHPGIAIPGGASIFPWQDELGTALDREAFNRSFLVQPAPFLRIRPGFSNIVPQRLSDAGITFVQLATSTLRLTSNAKLDEVLKTDVETVVQDLSSQRVGDYFSTALDTVRTNDREKIRAWDCCAGSGGKAIMLYDLDPWVKLSVSDIRESILVNLHKRFRSAGIVNYQSFVADLGSSFTGTKKMADLVIADVPCTGSGTWSRTPENLYYFDPARITDYKRLQQRIVNNVIPSVARGGVLIYITCSVFEQENEAVVNSIINHGDMTLISMNYLAGYADRADSMFVALLRKKA